MQPDNRTASKIIPFSAISEHIRKWKQENKKIVFTNGCFDIIHRGHIELLMKASSEGDVLMVGLNTDLSVRGLKGNNRPFNDEVSRAMVLASFEYVDAVVLFDEETPLKLIQAVRPDFIVKGGDYRAEEIVGAGFVKSYGGKVIVVGLVEGYSTTLLEKKLREGNS